MRSFRNRKNWVKACRVVPVAFCSIFLMIFAQKRKSELDEKQVLRYTSVRALLKFYDEQDTLSKTSHIQKLEVCDYENVLLY